jgi:hypothetical protein
MDEKNITMKEEFNYLWGRVIYVIISLHLYM